MASLRSGTQVSISKWKMNELKSLCDFFIEIGWCKEYKNLSDQFEVFLLAIHNFDSKRELILDSIFKQVPALRKYLLLHGVFQIERKKHDWFIQYMLRMLSPTDKEIKNMTLLPKVPEDIINKLAIFDPKPIGVTMEPVRIEFGMWQKNYPYPIQIIDIDFERLGQTAIDTKDEISQHETIVLCDEEPSEYIAEGDLPF